MPDDPDDLAILGGVSAWRRRSVAEVIAEGVRNRRARHHVPAAGCELAQGYGIARSMPAADVPAWCASQQPDPRMDHLPPLNREDLPLLFA